MYLNWKFIKKNIFKIAFFIFFSFILYLVWFNFSHLNALKLINSDIEIERSKIENAIRMYYDKNGEYPNLLNNENNLKNIFLENEKYNFSYFYGEEKLYEIPSRINKNVEKSNKIHILNNKKGGWFYNINDGKIKPNVEID